MHWTPIRSIALLATAAVLMLGALGSPVASAAHPHGGCYHHHHCHHHHHHQGDWGCGCW